MSVPFRVNETNFKRSHKPSFAESELTNQDSLISNFNSLPQDDNFSSDPSVILKQNFSSFNSNNVTFGQFICQTNTKNKQNNLAYAITQKFPPKIKKEVQAIIDYYEGQLDGQRRMFWKVTEGRNQKRKEADFTLEGSRRQDTSGKDDRINELENRLMEKDQKIIELNKEITTLMTDYSRLKKQAASSPTKSSRTVTREDSIKSFQ